MRIKKENEMIKDILEKYNVYSIDLELDLLRYFEKIRLEILNPIIPSIPNISYDGLKENNND